jgi:hypothetical protein
VEPETFDVVINVIYVLHTLPGQLNRIELMQRYAGADAEASIPI